MCRQCIAQHFTGKTPPIDEQEWAAIEWPEYTFEVSLCRSQIKLLYDVRGCEVGGPLHVLTDDFSVSDSTLNYCDANLDEWMREWFRGDPLDTVRVVAHSRSIIELMREMTLDERYFTLACHWGYA